MRAIVVALLVATSGAWAQRGGGAGFGRLINPSGIPATTGGAGFGRLINPSGVGLIGNASRPVRPGGRGGFVGGPPRVAHPQHNRTVIVPYPVYYGGYYYGDGYDSYGYDAPPAPVEGDAYDSGYAAVPPQQQSPVVIINQNFQPDRVNPVMHDYSNTPLPAPGPEEGQTAPPGQASIQDGSQVIFLIAMKDHTIFPAVAYWVEGDTLNYITTQGVHNRASLGLVDRDFSKQLNRERNIDFSLPGDK